MIELAFVACLVANPGACEENKILLVEGTHDRCWIESNMRLARWSATHPEWQIESFVCREAGTGDKGA